MASPFVEAVDSSYVMLRCLRILILLASVVEEGADEGLALFPGESCGHRPLDLFFITNSASLLRGIIPLFPFVDLWLPDLAKSRCARSEFSVTAA